MAQVIATGLYYGMPGTYWYYILRMSFGKCEYAHLAMYDTANLMHLSFQWQRRLYLPRSTYADSYAMAVRAFPPSNQEECRLWT
jgi:hypothetical protein